MARKTFMEGWTKSRLCGYKPAIAIIVALLLLAIVPSPAAASPLEITNVSSGNITETTAVITWTTDELGNSTVYYGNSTELDLSESSSDFTLNHTINLGNLTSGTLYYYRVSSTNQSGNTTISPGNETFYTFNTEPYPPRIWGVSVGDITDTSATVTWMTDRLADSAVEYGKTLSLGQSIYDFALVLNHTIILPALEPSTLYHFRVISTNQYGNTTTDSNGPDFYTFTTGLPPPTISGVGVTNVIDTSVTVTWTTNQLGNSSVFYGTTTALGDIASSPEVSDNHAINLTGLIPDTLYYYRVSTTNTEGRTSVSPEDDFYTFKTAVRIELQGWGWCTNYSKVVPATLDGYALFIEREHAPESYSMQAWGNFTLQPPDMPAEIISLDMYGSRVRSLFYLRQEETGKSATFEGVWIDGNDTQSYIMIEGSIALPNPEGEAFKTARLCFTLLRTPEVEVPAKEPDGFAADVEVVIAWFTKYFDRFIDALIGTGVGDILSNILTKIMILIAEIRALGTPYTP